nr:aminotransferase class I/II-fold pyridoxal phosphate-dependent enzyme [Candidatus Bathyarchaeota archaeon]
MGKASERISRVKYAIRDLIVHAKRLEEKGRKIIYLNIGDPAPFFEVPSHVREAMVKAVMERSAGYAPSEGIPEFREAVCRKEREVNEVTSITPDDVIATAGVSEGIQLVMQALADPGDEVLLPDPTYPPYRSYAALNGVGIRTYSCLEDEGWTPDVDDLRSKMDENVKAVFLINPNNPCGSVYPERRVKEIVDVAGEYGVPIVSDEIYDQIVYEGRFRSAASLAEDVPVIGLNGLSKTYLVPGWRLGYVYFHDPEGVIQDVKEGVVKGARVRLSVNVPAQVAGAAALNGSKEHVKELVSALRERRDYTFKRLSEIHEFHCEEPRGAFYVFPRINLRKWRDDLEFVIEVLNDAGVLLVNGSGFGENGGWHFRMVFLPTVDILEEAFNRLEEFMKRKRSG